MSDLSAAKALLRLGPNLEEQEPVNLLVNSFPMATVDTNAGRVSPEAAATAPAVLSNNTNQQFFEGSCSLYLKEDEESLSPLHCFMRKYCVEVFSASNQDVQGKHGRKIEQYQVGIQCLHCKHRPYPLRGERAVCFPSSLKNIYHSIETWQRRHSMACQDMPVWVKVSMMQLMGQSRSGAGGRRVYWEESARMIGIDDTPNGLRFVRPPGQRAATAADQEQQAVQVPGRPVVTEEDRTLVTPYLFALMSQMETCRFGEMDRTGGRSKVKSCDAGFPGLQCKHCGGKAGFGRYFPVSVLALSSANSDRNIYNHMVKCRRCPDAVRQELSDHLYRQEHQKNRRGSRKQFFALVWERMQQLNQP